MREIGYQAIVETVRDLCIQANYSLPQDIRAAIRRAVGQETSPIGRGILEDLIENYTIADCDRLPICQDTGLAVVFVDLGQEVHITGGLLTDAVNQGVRQGYLEGDLRCSIVADPLRRANTEDNTPAVIHLRLVAGDGMNIVVAPKGFGSENMSVLHMFSPSASQAEIEDYIVAAVERAGANPCPPVIVGVGLGGTAESVSELAKRALLLPADETNKDPFYADMEGRLLQRINLLGIGPQGLGGKTTALAVHILCAPTHIAGLPCAVHLGCHVTRHASKIL